jgi:hypothetical protein
MEEPHAEKGQVVVYLAREREEFPEVGIPY